ncbi:MAG: hypothetical protein P4L83_06070 [Nevskia sp.]|nr:hypothetical protein [Nevskia sp.]
MAGAPQPTAADLDALWRQLGVSAEGEGVRLLDDAPLAAVRKAITANDSNRGSPT